MKAHENRGKSIWTQQTNIKKEDLQDLFIWYPYLYHVLVVSTMSLFPNPLSKKQTRLRRKKQPSPKKNANSKPLQKRLYKNAKLPHQHPPHPSWIDIDPVTGIGSEGSRTQLSRRQVPQLNRDKAAATRLKACLVPPRKTCYFIFGGEGSVVVVFWGVYLFGIFGEGQKSGCNLLVLFFFVTLLQSGMGQIW